MNLRKLFAVAGFVLLTTSVAPAQPAATAPAQPAAPGHKVEELTAEITGVEGLVQVRTAEGQPWRHAEVGMKLDQGGEFRTGPRSAVRFTIPPGQTITLDRLGTIQLVQAVRDANKIKTDLGMKYGRTRYDIEAAGMDHDATIHSPGATLSIRGTKVSLYDQPPFDPEARSLTGHALFGNRKGKPAPFGKNKPTVLAKNDGSAAQTANVSTRVDPSSPYGRTTAENNLLLSLAAYGGHDFSQLGVLAFLEEARRGQFSGSVIGSLPVGKELDFTLFWHGDPGSEVDLSVTTPKGEVLDKNNLNVPSGGNLNLGVADSHGNGSQSAQWPISFPKGNYQVSLTLVTPGIAQAEVVVKQDPLGTGTIVGDFKQTLDSTGQSTFTTTVHAPKKH